MSSPYISLSAAKRQLRIDEGNQLHDIEIQDAIDGAVDWAENYTNRSLSELVELNSPPDSAATPVADPAKPSGLSDDFIFDRSSLDWVDTSGWRQANYRAYWANNPGVEFGRSDESLPLRRDLKMGILLYMQTLFDRNIEDLPLLEKRAKDLLWPYRKAMGVG